MKRPITVISNLDSDLRKSYRKDHFNFHSFQNFEKKNKEICSDSEQDNSDVLSDFSLHNSKRDLRKRQKVRERERLQRMDE